jgi:hypothetical protein
MGLIDPDPKVIYFLERSILFLTLIHRLVRPPRDFLPRFAREAFIDGADGQQAQPAAPAPAGIPRLRKFVCILPSLGKHEEGEFLQLAGGVCFCMLAAENSERWRMI